MREATKPEEHWAGRREEWRARWGALDLEDQRGARAAAEHVRAAESPAVAEVASGYGLFPRVATWLKLALVAGYFVLAITLAFTDGPSSLWSLAPVSAVVWTQWMQERRRREGRAVNLAAFLRAEDARRRG